MISKKIKTFKKSEFVTVFEVGAVLEPDFAIDHFIPVLMLDCANNNSIPELIELHQETLPGDVRSSWGGPYLWRIPNKIYLVLEFTRPTVTNVVIELSTDKHSGTIDGIVQTGGVYLLASEKQDAAQDFLTRPRIIAEIFGDFPQWSKTYRKILQKRFLKAGYPKKELKQEVNQYILESRERWNPRKKN
jgi:hypothetical protein